MYMNSRPIRSVNKPKNIPPTKTPTRLAAPISPISVDVGDSAGSRVGSATPTIVSAYRSMNGPPDE